MAGLQRELGMVPTTPAPGVAALPEYNAVTCSSVVHADGALRDGFDVSDLWVKTAMPFSKAGSCKVAMQG